jgi:hypothetical protein
VAWTTKKVLAALCLTWNLLIICPTVLGTLFDAARDSNHVVKNAYPGYEVAFRRGEFARTQPNGTADAEAGMALIIAFFAIALPPLGAFISHAKKRGLTEGYILVTFFGPIGLIVALCLPNRPQGP